jgi:hypothetical protein
MTVAFSIFTLLWFIACSDPIVPFQELPILFQEAEITIKTKHPGFEIVKKTVGAKEVIYNLQSLQGGKMRLLLFYGTSEEEAVERMKVSLKWISVGPDKKLIGVGDDAYLWVGHGRDHGVVRFRKSNVYVELSAPSVALAEDLATNLANIIKGK